MCGRVLQMNHDHDQERTNGSDQSGCMLSAGQASGPQAICNTQVETLKVTGGGEKEKHVVHGAAVMHTD